MWTGPGRQGRRCAAHGEGAHVGLCPTYGHEEKDYPSVVSGVKTGSHPDTTRPDRSPICQKLASFRPPATMARTRKKAPITSIADHSPMFTHETIRAR